MRHGDTERTPIGTQSLRAALALGAAAALSGCVAAAIPVLAAGGLVKARTDGSAEGSGSMPTVALPADPAPSAIAARTAQDVPTGPSSTMDGTASGAAREYAFADGTKVSVVNNLARPANPDSSPPVPGAAQLTPLTGLPPPSAAATSAAPPALSSGARLTSLTELPPSSGRPDAVADGFASFAAYVAKQAAIPVVGSERSSAILADAGSLSGETRPCSIHPAAVLIDLDPAGGLVETPPTKAADAAFAAQLAALRREEVVIGWTSSRTADRAGAIRAALRSSGLDPEGRDQLVLLRFPEESKQTRRDEFAKSHCVVAIAGDERADFDELFTYLRDPSTAAPLDKLIGAGWFIVPTPLPN